MYDPLVDPNPPSESAFVNSIWMADEHKGQAIHCPTLNAHEHCQVVIIGAGFTGLSCALQLSQQYNVNCTIVEANQPGWGCSGRNGGFVLPGTGRLSIQQMCQRWGKASTQLIYAEYLHSIHTVETLIKEGIDCQRTDGGYLKLAHKESLLAPLHEQAKTLSDEYGDTIIPLSRAEVQADYLSGNSSYGGIYYPNAIGINPWLFCQGLATKTQQAGVTIYGNSPVIECKREKHQHVIKTPSGSIRADTLILASNGYGQRQLHQALLNRTFPVISSIIVTEPLSSKQITQLGMKQGLMVMDTRALKYYYRLLPDNRLLFGGRGAIYGKHADDQRYLHALKKGLFETFPKLKDIRISHFWSGWVSVSLDDYPRIFHEHASNTLYSAGYCGAGLAFSVQAGKRLAQLLIEPGTLPDLPYWKTPLASFPLPALRRPALRAFYAWEGFKQRLFART